MAKKPRQSGWHIVVEMQDITQDNKVVSKVWATQTGYTHKETEAHIFSAATANTRLKKIWHANKANEERDKALGVKHFLYISPVGQVRRMPEVSINPAALHKKK